MKGRIKEDDQGVPMPDGGWAFTRLAKSGQHPQFCLSPVDDPEQMDVTLDGGAEAKNQTYFCIADAHHSDDHGLLAWSADTSGSEQFATRVRDLATGEKLEDLLEETTASMAWATDNRHLFCTKRDPN